MVFVTEITVPIDSYFWQKFTWPEGASVYFNVIEGHSEDWGVSLSHLYQNPLEPRSLTQSHHFFGVVCFFIGHALALLFHFIFT